MDSLTLEILVDYMWGVANFLSGHGGKVHTQEEYFTSKIEADFESFHRWLKESRNDRELAIKLSEEIILDVLCALSQPFDVLEILYLESPSPSGHVSLREDLNQLPKEAMEEGELRFYP